MKWALVAAGAKDLARPADKLSVPQSVGTYFSCALCFRIPHMFNICCDVQRSRRQGSFGSAGPSSSSRRITAWQQYVAPSLFFFQVLIMCV